MLYLVLFFFCKQKTAYEMRISDWSSDVCSSDLRRGFALRGVGASGKSLSAPSQGRGADSCFQEAGRCCAPGGTAGPRPPPDGVTRSEEHTSELQSLMRLSYAVFCLKTQNNQARQYTIHYQSIPRLWTTTR